MENTTQKIPSRLSEAALWSLANIFLMCLAIAALSVAKTIFGWSSAQWIFSSLAVSILSATWGSWAALTWTHHRVLRALMVVVTLLPGLLMVAVGIWAFLTIPDNRWIWKWGWVILIGHGAGATAMAALLGGRGLLQRTCLQVRARRLAIGWTLYPLLISAASVALVVATFNFFPDLITGGDKGLDTLLRWIIPSQALILFTTGLPAGCAQICRALSRAERGK